MSTQDRLQMEQILARLEGRPRLLLHCCCAPCSSHVLCELSEHFALTLFFSNANLDTRAEYDKRLGEVLKLTRALPEAAGVPVEADPYDPAAFEAAARGFEHEPEGGARCARCFEMRLSAAAAHAASGGYDWFATTLSVSPHKDAALLNRLGFQCAQAANVAFLPADFKKKNGYAHSVALSKQYGLYRQNYCGCVFSKRDR